MNKLPIVDDKSQSIYGKLLVGPPVWRHLLVVKEMMVRHVWSVIDKLLVVNG